MIINEMIREYLTHNDCHHSVSVLLTETGQPIEPPFDKDFLHNKFVSAAPRIGDKPILNGK